MKIMIEEIAIGESKERLYYSSSFMNDFRWTILVRVNFLRYFKLFQQLEFKPKSSKLKPQCDFFKWKIDVTSISLFFSQKGSVIPMVDLKFFVFWKFYELDGWNICSKFWRKKVSGNS